MQAKFGIIEIPRSIETACENARLAEEHGFDMVGVALFRELFVTQSLVFASFSKSTLSDLYRWRDRAARAEHVEEIDIWALGRVNVGEDRARTDQRDSHGVSVDGASRFPLHAGRQAGAPAFRRRDPRGAVRL